MKLGCVVGRLNSKLQHEHGTLAVRQVYWEPQLKVTKARQKKLDEALARRLLKCCAQHVAQLFDDAHSGLAFVVAHEHRDRVEGMKEEIWIDLRLLCSEPCTCELCREACDLDFALACFDEIPNSMLNADNAEIHGNAAIL